MKLLSELEVAPILNLDFDGDTTTNIIRRVRRAYRKLGIEEDVFKDAGKWFITEEYAKRLGVELCSNLYKGKIHRVGGSEERSKSVTHRSRSMKVQDYLKPVN